jgi:tRNA nucleotidyltransferase/poly(A) polymerase
VVISWLKSKLKSKKSKPSSKAIKSLPGLDPDAADIVVRLANAGFESYLVGGCVRDFLLGSRPKDFDIATSASPQQIKALIKRSTIIGKRFKIVLARRYNPQRNSDYAYCPSKFLPVKDKEFQITTFRRKPEMVGETLNENVFGTAKDDALRRDFTINALFMDPRSGKIIDFLNGQKDLQNKVIRVIGDPEDRYTEDPVRLLRALRFMVRINFKLSESDEPAFKRCAIHLASAKKERTREEILKSFREGYSAPFLRELRKKGFWQHLNPSYFADVTTNNSLNFVEKLAESCDKNPWSHPLMMGPFFFVLLHHRVLSGELQDSEVGLMAQDFRMSNAEKESLLFLAQSFSRLRKNGSDPQRKEKFLQHIQRSSEKFFTFYYCFKILADANLAPYSDLFRTFEKDLEQISRNMAHRSPPRRGPAGRGRRRPPSRRGPPRPPRSE